MKVTLQQLTFLALQGFHQVSGHYGFPFVVVDGVVSKRWQYTRPAAEFSPNYDYEGITVMCGRNATLPLFPVETLKIEAGSTIGFGAATISGYYTEHENFQPFDPNFHIYHDGPATAYLSKAPGEPNDYAGDGDWFKIQAIGASDGLQWDVGQMKRTGIMNFTIPKETPPGKYLLRGEHLNIQSAYKSTEMYSNCVHVEITGSGKGTPGPTTKFPGAFKATDDGIWLPSAMMRPLEPLDELKNWQGAGPKVWKG